MEKPDIVKWFEHCNGIFTDKTEDSALRYIARIYVKRWDGIGLKVKEQLKVLTAYRDSIIAWKQFCNKGK